MSYFSGAFLEGIGILLGVHPDLWAGMENEVRGKAVASEWRHGPFSLQGEEELGQEGESIKEDTGGNDAAGNII